LSQWVVKRYLERMKGKSPTGRKRLNMMSDVMVKELHEKTKWKAANRANRF